MTKDATPDDPTPEVRGNTKCRIAYHFLVSSSFQPPPGVLFNFLSRYSYTIGLELYLELGVGTPVFTPHSKDITLETI